MPLRLSRRRSQPRASRDRRAHTVGDKVEAAYRCGDLFVKQRALAEAWARYCDGAEVVRFSGRATVGVAQVLTQDKSLPLVKGRRLGGRLSGGRRRTRTLNARLAVETSKGWSPLISNKLFIMEFG